MADRAGTAEILLAGSLQQDKGMRCWPQQLVGNQNCSSDRDNRKDSAGSAPEQGDWAGKWDLRHFGDIAGSLDLDNAGMA